MFHIRLKITETFLKTKKVNNIIHLTTENIGLNQTLLSQFLQGRHALYPSVQQYFFGEAPCFTSTRKQGTLCTVLFCTTVHFVKLN